ncbi:MAG TPA: hypothetical protein VIS72_13165 [Anaerolineales bacterium]
MGPGFAYIPGDLLDNRFNNYILEHFYRWVIGRDASYWNAGIYFPFPNTIAFSENLLGTAPLYACFRWLGYDRETSFQAWYILGFFFNFASSFYVFQKIGAKPLASGAGAFFYSFGLPIMGQEIHAQLVYRCGVPLACYFFWDFSERPKLWKLLLVGLCFIWQIYISIYNGIFLGLLLLAIFILFPFFLLPPPGESPLMTLPRKLQNAWRETPLIWRTIFVASSTALLASLFALLWPYYSVTKMYGFTRTSSEVFSLLPKPESYILADNSLIWGNLSASLPNIKFFRWEHQLFPGLSVIIMILASFVWRPKLEYRRLAWLHFCAMLMLIGVTFDFHGYSLYHLLSIFPGINSIRAVTRIVLILMWPTAVFITSVLDSMLELTFSGKTRTANWLAYIFISLLLIETLAFRHLHFSKADAQNRLAEIKNMIPADTPQDPILVLHIIQQDWYQDGINEIDAMLVAQDLGWPTLNGYSGNSPKGYVVPNTCRRVHEPILAYMHFAGITNQQFYRRMSNRIIPLGFTDCDLRE